MIDLCRLFFSFLFFFSLSLSLSLFISYCLHSRIFVLPLALRSIIFGRFSKRAVIVFQSWKLCYILCCFSQVTMISRRYRQRLLCQRWCSLRKCRHLWKNVVTGKCIRIRVSLFSAAHTVCTMSYKFDARQVVEYRAWRTIFAIYLDYPLQISSTIQYSKFDDLVITSVFIFLHFCLRISKRSQRKVTH